MRKADRLYAMVALLSGVLVASTWIAVPAFGQTATVARIDLVPEDPANASRVGSVLLQRVGDGSTFTITGLANAVPPRSTIQFSRNGVDLGITRTARNTGAFPFPDETLVELPYEEGATIGLRITDPSSPTEPFSASFVVNFTAPTGDPHKLVPIVADDPNAGVSFGNVLLTQRQVGGVVLDEFEGLRDAVPPFAKVEVFRVPLDQVPSEAEWLLHRIHLTVSAEALPTGFYLSSGRITPWTIPNLHSGQPTQGDVYPESKVYLRVTTREGQVVLASIQDDVSVDLDDSQITFITNNVRNPDGTFPLTPPVVARVVGPAGTLEPFSSAIARQEVDGEIVTLGAADADWEGSVSLDIVPNAPAGGLTNQADISLEGMTARLEDRFGNVLVVPLPNPDQEALVFEGPTVTKAEDDPAVLARDVVGHVEGIVEPASVVVVSVTEAYALTEDSSFLVISVGNDGSFAFDVRRAPTVNVNVIDPAGNVNELGSVEIDTAVRGTTGDLTVTKAEDDPAVAAAGIVGRIQGTIEPRALVYIRAESVGGVTEGGPFLLDTVQAADDGTFTYDVQASPSVDITLMDLAGNVSELGRLVIDDSVEPAAVDQVTLGFPSSRIQGTAEPNSGILVIGLASITPEILQSARTGDVVDSLPDANIIKGAIAEGTAGVDGSFSVTVPGFASQVVYLRVVDRAGNRSSYTTVVLGHTLTGQGLVTFADLTITNNPPGHADTVDVTLVDTGTGDPVPNIDVIAFAEFEGGEFRYPITDIDFPAVTGADGRLDAPLEIPDFHPLATEYNSSTVLERFYLVARDPASGDYIGARLVSAADGLDRVGPTISTVLPLIFTDEDLQLIQNGSEAPDILHIRNILPNTATGRLRIPADALNFVFIIANTEDSGQIDVYDLENLAVIDVKGFDAFLGVPYGVPALPIPGVSGLNLGYNFWNPQFQTYSGHRVVFVALMDAAGNFSPDPVPIVLDVETQDPDPDLIAIGDGVVTGRDGAVEAFSTVTIFGDTTLTDLLGSTTADSVGAFEVAVDTRRDALVVATRDQAGNRSNPINIKAAPTVEPAAAVAFLVLDGFGAIHTPSGTLAGSPSSEGLARKLGQAHDSPSVYYQLNSDGIVAGPLGGVAAPSLPEEDQILFSQKLARDLEIVSTEGRLSGYLLAGNGFVHVFGDATFYGDPVRDSLSAVNPRVTADSQRKRLDGTIFLEDSNANGEYDIFQFETEDKNGNGVLDPETVEFIPVDPNDPSRGVQQVVIPAEDVNGNGILDIIFDAEGLFDANEIGIGFGKDLARDLEVVYSPPPAPGESPTASPNVLGYMILDGWGVIHHYGTTPDLQNPHSAPGQDIFRAFELITDGEGTVRDFVVLNGYGQVYATPGGFLNAPPEDPQVPGGGGDLSFVLDPKPVFFGFDIARDIEVNPVDTNGDGVVGDGGDGFYILDGYGGIHAVGGAPPVENAPFLGFDIARDLEIPTSPVGAVTVPAQ